MDIRFRRKIFYLLVAVFLLLSPLLITYSLGYTFDFSNRRLDRLGGIFIKSETSRLGVFLNNSFQKETSFLSGGALLTGLEPWEYLLRLDRAGFQSWSRTVKVDPGLVTELRDVILFPNPVVESAATAEEKSVLANLFSPSLPYQLDSQNNLIQKTAISSKILVSNVKYFAMAGEKILLVDGNGFLARINLQDGSIQTIGRPGFVLNDKIPFRFMSSARGEAAVIDSAEGLYMLDSADKLYPLHGGVIQVAYDMEGNKLLIVSKNSMEVLWRADNTKQPFQTKGTRELILKTSTPILDAGWFYHDNAHVILRTLEGIFITELDGRGGRNTTELITGKTDSLKTSLDFPDKIFFGRDKKIYKLEF